MPTKKTPKGKIYFKAKDDDKYKELGIGTIEVNSEEEKEIKDYSCAEAKEYEFEIDANTGTFLEWSEERR